MRLKSTPLSCAFAWAPSCLGTPTFLATASLASAVDDNFSNEAFLEICSVDVTRTDETNMPIVGRTPIQERAFRLDWCSVGGPRGIIVVACSNGAVYVYDVDIIMKNYRLKPTSNTVDPLLCTIAEHRGAVRGCQFNPSQPNFLAIGADDGEWDVWTLEDPRDPQRVPVMSNAAHNSAIVHLQWHPKYPHIIATASANAVVNVWNLKSQSLAVSLNVSKGGKLDVSATAIAWHPVVATQIAVALDEKDSVIQIWDLKKSMMPLLEMRGHQGAITGLSWNSEDASMIASCGADGNTIWWNPITGERTGALEQEGVYMIDVQWSPALPALLATSSFGPLLCVSTAEDVSATVAAGAPVPKWLKKPCCASINLGNFVASLVPGSIATIGLTRIQTKDESNAEALEDFALLETLRRLSPGSAERVDCLRSQNYTLLAAASACKEDRAPILAYLNEESTSYDENEDPFETMQISKKSLEDIAASHIVAGRICEAVEVCLDKGRFDDAFAMACLQGGKLLERVQQEYARHTLKQHQERRHVVYAAAIASGNFALLTDSENIPWKEALSAIISFVGDGFSEACDKLGNALRVKGNKDGAMTCYICSGNLDAVMQLWSEESVTVKKMVREAFLLEEVTGRRVTSLYFADCLYNYGMDLVHQGLIAEAMPIFQRSASIGNRGAAVMADRLKFEIPVGQIAFPFAMMPLADSPSASCANFLASKHQQQQQFLMPKQQPMPTAMQPMTHQQQRQLPQMQGNVDGFGLAGPATSSAAPHMAPTIQPRLMQHPNSSQPSMTQKQPFSTTASSAFTSASETYGSDGFNLVPPQRQQLPQGQGVGHTVLQQRYSYANSSMPPPPLPTQQPQLQAQQTLPFGSQGQAFSATQPPMGPPVPSRGQVPALSHSNTGAMQQPQSLAASLAPRQQSSEFAANSFAATQSLPNNGIHQMGAGNSASGSYAHTQRDSQAPYRNHVPAPPTLGDVHSSIPLSGQLKSGASNSSLAYVSKETSPNKAQLNLGVAGTLSQQPQLMRPSNTLQSQNPIPQPVVATPTSSAYGTSFQAPNVYPTASQYAGSGISSGMSSRGSLVMPSASPASNDDGGLSSFDITSLNHEHQGLAQKLCASVQQVSNPQRRSAVSKAAVELFKMLQRGSLSQDVVALIINYVNAVGTPAAKTEWRLLSSAHFDTIQPFLNLKFL